MKINARNNTISSKVDCLPYSREEIETLAVASGKATSSYLLAVGLGYRTKNVLGHRRVDKLQTINGDLGRRGGLQLWLTNDR